MFTFLFIIILLCIFGFFVIPTEYLDQGLEQIIERFNKLLGKKTE